MGDAARAAGAENSLRPGGAAVHAQEGVTGGVEAVRLPVRPENRVVIPPLPVLGLVIDRGAQDLHLAGGVVALEVGAVIHGVPEAELHIGEEAQRLVCGTLVADGDAHEQTVVPQRDEELLPDANALFLSLDHGVAQAVAAGITVQLRLHRLPAGIPDLLAVLYIDMKALGIQRTVVVAVARQPAQPRVSVKGVAARGIGAECEKGLAAQIIDPGQGRARSGDHILPARIIKISELHDSLLMKTFKFMRSHLD